MHGLVPLLHHHPFHGIGLMQPDDDPRPFTPHRPAAVALYFVYPVLIIPIYIDSSTVTMGAIYRKLKNMAKSEDRHGQDEVGWLYALFPSSSP